MSKIKVLVVDDNPNFSQLLQCALEDEYDVVVEADGAEGIKAAAAGKPALASDGVNVIYYNRATGKFYKVFPDGRTVPVSEEVFYQVQNVSWSPDKNKAVLEYPDGANIVYDF